MPDQGRKIGSAVKAVAVQHQKSITIKERLATAEGVTGTARDLLTDGPPVLEMSLTGKIRVDLFSEVVHDDNDARDLMWQGGQGPVEDGVSLHGKQRFRSIIRVRP